MSAVLTADAGDTEKIAEIIRECERMGIPVLPPDINESYGPFSVVPVRQGTNQHQTTPSSKPALQNAQGQGADEKRSESYQAYGEQASESATQHPVHSDAQARIRFGLTTIKNFGEGIAEEIVEERKTHGPFISIADFLTRVTSKNLNKKSLEALIMTGCFDRFEDRAILLHNLDTLLAFHKEASHGKEAAQDSLFGGLVGSTVHELILSPGPESSPMERLRAEKELLGVYVSGHPLDAYKTEMDKRPSIRSIKRAVEERQEIAIVRMKGEVVTTGMIESVRELLTKKGDRMAFIALSDKEDMIEMVAFPETYQTFKDTLIPGACVAVKGKLTIRNDAPSIAIDRVKSLTHERENPKTPSSTP
jgi:DNA polymerase-3 subunit alpha